MGHDLDDLDGTQANVPQPGPSEDQGEAWASTTPLIDTWSERPTLRLSPVKLPIWLTPAEPPDGLVQQFRYASRRAQLGMSFGTLLFFFFFAVLIAGALSSGGVLASSKTNPPNDSSIQIGPGVVGTSTPRPGVTGPVVPTSTPNKPGGTGGSGGTGVPPAYPTPTQKPPSTATPKPTPTATATPAPTPTFTPVPTPTPAPTATPVPTPTDTPTPAPTATPDPGNP